MGTHAGPPLFAVATPWPLSVFFRQNETKERRQIKISPAHLPTASISAALSGYQFQPFHRPRTVPSRRHWSRRLSSFFHGQIDSSRMKIRPTDGCIWPLPFSEISQSIRKEFVNMQMKIKIKILLKYLYFILVKIFIKIKIKIK